MNIVVSPSFEELTVTFDDAIDPITITGGTGYCLLNCDAEEIEIDMDAVLATLDSGSFTISVADVFAGRTTFKDGVYKFVFELYDAEGGGHTHSDSFCLFIGTTTNCKVANWIICEDDDLIEYLLKALQHINDCDDCDCSLMCDIYDTLQNRLDYLASKSTANVYNDCGC